MTEVRRARRPKPAATQTRRPERSDAVSCGKRGIKSFPSCLCAGESREHAEAFRSRVAVGWLGAYVRAM